MAQKNLICWIYFYVLQLFQSVRFAIWSFPMLLFRRLIEAVIIIGDVIWGLPSSSEDGMR